MATTRDPREIVDELRRLRHEFELLPKVRAPMFIRLLTLCDELMAWDRALRRWAKEYDALLFRFVEQIDGSPNIEDELDPENKN